MCTVQFPRLTKAGLGFGCDRRTPQPSFNDVLALGHGSPCPRLLFDMVWKTDALSERQAQERRMLLSGRQQAGPSGWAGHVLTGRGSCRFAVGKTFPPDVSKSIR